MSVSVRAEIASINQRLDNLAKILEQHENQLEEDDGSDGLRMEIKSLWSEIKKLQRDLQSERDSRRSLRRNVETVLLEFDEIKERANLGTPEEEDDPSDESDDESQGCEYYYIIASKREKVNKGVAGDINDKRLLFYAPTPDGEWDWSFNPDKAHSFSMESFNQISVLASDLAPPYPNWSKPFAMPMCIKK